MKINLFKCVNILIISVQIPEYPGSVGCHLSL